MSALTGATAEADLHELSTRHRELFNHVTAATRYAVEGGEPLSLAELAGARAIGWVKPWQRIEVVLPDGPRRPLTRAELADLQALESGVRG